MDGNMQIENPSMNGSGSSTNKRPIGSIGSIWSLWSIVSILKIMREEKIIDVLVLIMVWIY